MKTPLPEFERPPVTEVAAAVAFKLLPNWKPSHSGLYWSRIIAEYPLSEVHGPIVTPVDSFDDGDGEQAQRVVEIPWGPEFQRTWFLSDPANSLIQVQRDRFVVNWRKQTGEETYPRYMNEVRPRFAKEWELFCIFLREQNIGIPEIVQCELTYLNDIPIGSGWETFDESLSLFSPWWNKGSDGFLPKPENLTIGGAFPMHDPKGRLHFSAQRVLRQIDGKDAIHLQLIARSNPSSSAMADVLASLDAGHDWIVRGFTDLTSARAHELWGRTR